MVNRGVTDGVDGRTRRVHVVALTFRRPTHLAELLPSLVRQAHSATDERTRVDVVIVDNDPDAGARDSVLQAAEGVSGTTVRYVHESRPGIAVARNAALDASADADLLAFIDDDERPRDGWLLSLLAAYDRYQPAAVVGPVISVFDSEPPAWTVAGRFWERRRHPTGTRVPVGDTNNLLIDLHKVRRAGVRFDESLRMGGGEDNLFTQQLRAHAGELVWCDEAVVTDIVPPERVQPRWLARRRFHMAANRVVVALRLREGRTGRMWVRLRFAAVGGVEIVRGAAMWAGGAVLRHIPWRANGSRHLVRGCGMLAGAFGYHGQQYARASADAP